MIRVLGAVLMSGAAVSAQEVPDQDFAAASAAYDAKDWPAAIAALDRSIAKKPTVGAYFLRAVCHRLQGDFDAAIADATAVLAMDEKGVGALLERGYCKVKKGQVEQGIEDYDRAIALDPANAIAFGDRGDALQLLGRLEQARRDYDRAIELDKWFGAAYWNRARVCGGMGDWRSAVRDYSRTSALLPRNASVWLDRCSAERYVGKLSAALASCEQAIELAKDAPASWIERSTLKGLLGENRASREDTVRAIGVEVKPTARAFLQNRLGCLLLLDGECAAAREHFALCVQDAEVAPWSTFMAWCTYAPGDVGGATELDRRLSELPAEQQGIHRLLREVCLGPLDAMPDLGALHPDWRCLGWFLRGWRQRALDERGPWRSSMRRCWNTGNSHSLQGELAWRLLQGEPAPTLAPTLAVELQAPAGPADGLVVVAVAEGGAASAAGLLLGDRVVQINHQPATADWFAAVNKGLAVSTPVRFQIVRGETRSVLWVMAGVAPE